MKLEWKTCLRAGISIFVLYLCIHYWSGAAGLLSMLAGAAVPLVLGCMIAYLVNILMSFYEKHLPAAKNRNAGGKLRRPLCMLAAFATLFAIAALVLCLVLPQLVSCVQLIFALLPEAMKTISTWVEELDFLPENLSQTLAGVDWQSRIGQVLQVVTSGLGSVMDVAIRTVSTVFSGLVTLLIGVIFSVYVLMGKERLSGQFDRLFRRYLKQGWYNGLIHILQTLDDCFHRYIVGQCTEAVILGLLCMAGMLVLRLPYATMVGALIAFTALIPVAGAYIGAGVSAFMILTVSPVKAIIFLIFIVVLQQLEGNLIYPRVVGSSMGLPAIWVLAAVTIGGGMLGIAGMLLGVPLAAAIYRLVREDVRKGEDSCKAEAKTEAVSEKVPE